MNLNIKAECTKPKHSGLHNHFRTRKSLKISKNDAERVRIMRTKILIAVSILLPALFAIGAYSIDNEYGFSADQLIDASNGIYPSSGPIESPQEERAQMSKTSDVDNTQPTEVSESSTINTSQTAPSQEVETPSPSATSAAGNWSFSLMDSENISMTLTLYQPGNTLFGTGTMNENNGTQMISASGLLFGDNMDLNVTSPATASLYSLSVTKKENTASGEYKAITSGGASWTGNVEGILTI